MMTVDGFFTGWAIDGTPADCVKLAILELYKTDFDLVVSGMNIGANVGVDMLYSGTVAAAVEGAFYGIPAVAISSKAGQSCLKKAAREGVRVLKKFIAELKAGDIFNINVPLLDEGLSKGIKLVRQAESMYKEKYTSTHCEDGKVVFQIGSENHYGAEEGTDRHAIHNGYCTVTPLSYAMTHHGTLKRLEQRFARGNSAFEAEILGV
jgi:5'-nucleotidase